MAVTDLRTQLDPGTSEASWVDAAGASAGGANTEVAPPFATSSISDKVSKTIDGLMYDDGGIGTFAAGDHIFMWYYVLFGALDTVAGGGVRFRVTGATVTDWAEVTIGGSDSGQSGWQLAVISIDEVLANPTLTNDTPPTAATIQRMGIIIDITGTVGGNNDNFAIQAIYRQPASVAGSYRVDAGTDGAPNTWATIITQVETDTTGVVVEELNGTITLNGPIVFGPDTGDEAVDTTFEDTGVVLAFKDNQFVEADFYKLAIDLPASYTGDARVTAGTKIGSGETAVGVAGWTIITGGPRYTMEFENADQTDIQFYGCSFQSSGIWSVDDTAVEIISCVFSDCDTLTMTGNVTTGPVFLSNFFSAAPGTGPQIDLLANPRNGQFDFNSFTNMTDFAIEISENGPVSYDLRGVKFSGNGANGDIEFTHASGLVTVNILEFGDLPSVTQTGSGTNLVISSVPVEVNGVTEGAQCYMEADDGGPLGEGTEILNAAASPSGVADSTFGGTTPQGVIIRARSSGTVGGVIIVDDGAGTETNQTTAARDRATTDDVMLVVVGADIADYLYIGAIDVFERVNFDVGIAGTGAYQIGWEYWNGGSWVILAGANPTDTTNNFKNVGNGKLSWDAATGAVNWAARSISYDTPSAGSIDNMFWIRGSVFSGTMTIQPFANTISVAEGNTVKYLPFETTGIIVSGTGLVSTAVWLPDTIAS